MTGVGQHPKRPTAKAPLPLLALSVLFECSAVLAMFFGWDAGGRSSFSLLATADRAGLTPSWFPATPFLMWWVLTPVMLLASAAAATRPSTRRFRPWALAPLCIVSLVAWGASKVPGSTFATLLCFWLSVGAVLLLALEATVLLKQRRKA